MRPGDEAPPVKLPIEQMGYEEFERQFRILMRRNPRVIEEFLRRYARAHGTPIHGVRS